MGYQIIRVDDWTAIEEESLGSKEKVWLERESGDRWLFKYSRSFCDGTLVGEHWAEKIAAEVAESLAIPHAEVELASRKDVLGVVSRDFTNSRDCGTLVLGNELLFQSDHDYERDQQKPSSHTVHRVMEFLGNPTIGKPRGFLETNPVMAASDVFVGYLMLDALVGNTDRHHENWGVLYSFVASDKKATIRLAPSFDHASSLGRELSDEVRMARLSGQNPNRTVEGYCARGRSPFYSEGPEPRQLTVREAFANVYESNPLAAGFWLSKLEKLPKEKLHLAVQGVPEAVMSSPMKTFACKLLDVNREFLLKKDGRF